MPVIMLTGMSQQQKSFIRGLLFVFSEVLKPAVQAYIE